MAFFLRIVGADFTAAPDQCCLIHEKAEWGRKKNGAGSLESVGKIPHR